MSSRGDFRVQRTNSIFEAAEAKPVMLRLPTAKDDPSSGKMIAAINLTTNSLMFGGMTPGEVPVAANRHIGSANGAVWGCARSPKSVTRLPFGSHRLSSWTVCFERRRRGSPRLSVAALIATSSSTLLKLILTCAWPGAVWFESPSTGKSTGPVDVIARPVAAILHHVLSPGLRTLVDTQ